MLLLILLMILKGIVMTRLLAFTALFVSLTGCVFVVDADHNDHDDAECSIILKDGNIVEKSGHCPSHIEITTGDEVKTKSIEIEVIEKK